MGRHERKWGCERSSPHLKRLARASAPLGLGSFYYKLSCAGNGVDTPEEVSREQVKAVRVQFIPERRKKCGKYCRALGEGVELVKLGD